MIQARNLKMYVLIPESVPDDWAPLVAAHAPLSFFRKYSEEQDVKDWIEFSYKKVVCKVTDEQFEFVKQECLVPFIVTTESGLGGKEVTLVISPSYSPAKWLKELDMWKVNQPGG